MDGLETVADVGQRAILNDGHRVIDERFTHVIVDAEVDDGRGLGTHRPTVADSYANTLSPKAEGREFRTELVAR